MTLASGPVELGTSKEAEGLCRRLLTSLTGNVEGWWWDGFPLLTIFWMGESLS